MVEIQTRTTVDKWARFKESDLKTILAAHLGVDESEINSFRWPFRSTIYPTLCGVPLDEPVLTVNLK
jgi:hypothetical protein